MSDLPPDRPEPPHTPGANPEQLKSPDRRTFIGAVLGIGSTIVGVLLAVPLFRFILFPVFHSTSQDKWASAGTISDFASLTGPMERALTVRHVDAWREVDSTRSVYVIPWKSGEGQVRVLSSICPHLGCLVQWDASADQFHCPCHGSIYSADGSLVRGPALRGMDPLPHRIQNGKLMVLFEYFEEDTKARILIS